jgi:histidyl-tRNA synthetase
MIQKPKGTIDLYGNDGKKFIYIQSLINEIMKKFNFEYIKTPTFEQTDLFKRGVGETTDIITKETYDFLDRSNRELTLRPEGTAGVVRSFIENKMYADSNQPKKLYYFSSAFRYERPQAGRLREHTQFGIEILGSDSILSDAEAISIGYNTLKMIGLKNIVLKINTLGDKESRESYKKALIDYLKPNIDQLCSDCQTRYLNNPLRILDCKVDQDSEVLKNIPKFDNYLNDISQTRFNEVKEALDALEIEYVVDNKLVRGLDYYCHTVFEFQTEISGFGSQNTICAGGRYNNLVETIGGPDTPGIGFGMGLERLLLAVEQEENNLLNERLDLFVVNLSSTKEEVYALVNNLRLNGFSVETDYLDKNLKAQFKQIERLNPKYFVIIGDEELLTNKVKIKDNDTKEEQEIDLFDLVDFLDFR